MCIILLQQQNRLSFQDDIRTYLPEVPDFGEEITVSHLLFHTSGLRDQMDLFRFAGWRGSDLRTQEDVLHFVANQRELNFSPGTEQLYSNTGYVLLAEMVARITGQTIREFAEENIFRPLGMTNTHFHDDHFEIIKNRAYAYASRRDGSFAIETPASEMVGSTGLFTTVEDLAKWVANFTHRRVGGEEGVDLLLTRGKLDNGEVLPFLGSGLAFSTHKGNEWVGFGGHHPGYRSEFAIFPEHDLSIIVLSNHENANLSRGRVGDLLFQVADIVIDDQYLIEEPRETNREGSPETPPEQPSLTEQQYSEYEGRYYSEELDVYYSWVFKEGTLFFRVGRLGEIPVNFTKMDEFSPGGGYLIEFIRNSDNEISAFTFSSGSVRKLVFQKVGEEDSKEL
jgi:CubicO group peptidase (beta-lactamase class C family)